MYISTFHLQNYKSFRDSQTLSLGKGFNVITGQNNSGKSALIEGLGFNFHSKPHTSLISKPNRTTFVQDKSVATVTFSLTQEELISILSDRRKEFHLTLASDQNHFFVSDKEFRGERLNQEFAEWVLGHSNWEFKLRFSPPHWESVRVPSFGFYEGKTSDSRHKFLTCNLEGGQVTVRNSTYDDPPRDLGIELSDVFRSQIYRFHAERRIQPAQFKPDIQILATDASNLASVLSGLQSEPSRFANFNALVRRVLPQIREVTVQHYDVAGENWAEIKVRTDEGVDRYDLALRLSECGTGIGQVLAILYVVFSSTKSQVILLEEPQSFLHPGAVRKLIEILKEFSSQHQFIVSSHLPSVIKLTNPFSVTQIVHNGQESELKQIDHADLDHLKGIIEDLGVSFSDAFAAEKVIWVEGATEEKCFPLLIKKFSDSQASDALIMAVPSTGELLGKHKELALKIYRRLSGNQPLLPRATAFIFDREKLSAQDIQDLERQSNEEMKFLSRRMYENFLINSAAIAAVLEQVDPDFTETKHSIEVWIDSNSKDRAYFRHLKVETGIDPINEWGIYIDAAEFLARLFAHCTQGRVRFEKTTHSVALTKWLIQNDPNHLKELGDWLIKVVGT